MFQTRPIPLSGQVAFFETSAGLRVGTSHSAVAIAASWGLVITIAQIALAVILAKGRTATERYYHLFEADSGWYQNIVDNGYYSPPVLTRENIGNVAFFPGYPLWVRCLKSALTVDTRTAALIASQLAAWAFWTYLLVFFQRWQLSPRHCVLGVLVMASHPAAFYLVAGYTESLFLAAALGFLYWASSHRREAFVLAAIHGIVMTGTRLVGVPLVVFSVCLVLFRIEPAQGAGHRSWLRAFALGGIATLGAALLFAYCAWRFGDWNLYAKTNEAGWHVAPNYRALFSHRIFHVHWPGIKETVIDPEFVSRLTVPVTVLLFVLAAVVEWRLSRRSSDSGWRVRVGFYACAFLLLYVPVSAHAARNMSSMIRFALCVQVMFLLAAGHLLSQLRLDEAANGRLARVCSAWCAVCFALQLMLTWRFVHGLWVA